MMMQPMQGQPMMVQATAVPMHAGQVQPVMAQAMPMQAQPMMVATGVAMPQGPVPGQQAP